MLTDEELSQGGYRFEDLLERRIISGRTDLERKQRQHGFPKPVKTGERQAWFPKAEVHAWLRERLALRDQPTQAPPSIEPKAQPSVAGLVEAGAAVESDKHVSKRDRRPQPLKPKAKTIRTGTGLDPP